MTSPVINDPAKEQIRKDEAMTYKTAVVPIAMALAILATDVQPVHATHFRGGTLTWQQAGGNKIRFTFNVAYRRSFALWSGIMPGGTFSDAADRFYFLRTASRSCFAAKDKAPRTDESTR
jgi:hypothetical protein